MFHRILVGFDGSPASRAALAQAVDIAVTQNASLTMLMVNHIPLVPGYEEADLTAVYAEADGAARRLLEATAADLPAGLAVETATSWGDPATIIVERARAANHDLIVLGSRRRGALRAAFLGSVAHAVLNHSHVPLLIVG